jgi:hypothetical protein
MNEFYRQLEVPIIRERMERLAQNRPENLHEYQGCANEQARAAEQPTPKCTCGYDARNNERDLDVNCSVHMAPRPPYSRERHRMNGCIEYDGEMGYPDNRCEQCKQHDTPAQPPAGMVERMVEKYAEVVKQPHLISEYGTMSCTAAMAAAAAVAHPEWFAKVCPKCNRPFDGGE